MPTASNKIDFPKDLLDKLYISDRFSIAQIAKIFGCSVIPVHRALREYQIPTRSISDAKREFNVNMETLKDLYLNQKLSTGQIAHVLGCNHVTVLNLLKRFGIQRRSTLGLRRPVQISRENLNSFYHQKKLTQKQIGNKFGHSPYGIQRWMKIYGIESRSDSESHTRYPKYDFSGDLMEKAYMIGFRLGDLNVYKVHELIQVRCSTTKIAQVELIESLFKKYGNVHVWKAKRGTYEIITLLNQSFNFLLPKVDMIEGWILAADDYFLSFLAGYADAEGCWYFKRHLGKIVCGEFTIQSYDKEIIISSSQKLEKMGVHCYGPFLAQKAGYVDKRGLRHNGDSWRFNVIRKADLWRFINLLSPFIKHRDKLDKIVEIKANLVERENLPYCHSIGIS